MQYNLAELLELNKDEVVRRVSDGEIGLACAWTNANNLNKIPLAQISLDLGLSPNTMQELLGLRNAYLESFCDKKHFNKAPRVIIGNLVYLACLITKQKLSQEKIAKYFGMTEVSLHQKSRKEILMQLTDYRDKNRKVWKEKYGDGGF